MRENPVLYPYLMQSLRMLATSENPQPVKLTPQLILTDSLNLSTMAKKAIPKWIPFHWSNQWAAETTSNVQQSFPWHHKQPCMRCIHWSSPASYPSFNSCVINLVMMWITRGTYKNSVSNNGIFISSMRKWAMRIGNSLGNGSLWKQRVVSFYLQPTILMTCTFICNHASPLIKDFCFPSWTVLHDAANVFRMLQMLKSYSPLTNLLL